MVELTGLEYVLPAVVGLFISFLAEHKLLCPTAFVVWRRSAAAVSLHMGSWLLLFSVALLLFQRPWFATANALAFQLLLLLVNQAKFYSLKEPFLFQDFDYFTDAIKHPRLYIPFFGLWRTVCAVVAFICAVSAGLMLEVSVLNSGLAEDFWIACMILFVTSGILLYAGFIRLPPPTLKPINDQLELGQMAFIWSYFRELKRNIDIQPSTSMTRKRKMIPARELSNLIVVQSESFFDPRLAYGCIKQDVLACYDRLKQEAICHGALRVPAWGANTVRTECAFLTGLTAAQLGIYQFNPYHKLAKQGAPNLVSVLKAAGYRTICIHPYPASFYLRDQVFPRMGFDEFIDISGFSTQDQDGQYIADMAVSKKVDQLLQQANDPLFIFVITMENHGPLHLESVQGGELSSLYQDFPPENCQDLSVYLHHLKNADRMQQQLAESLKLNHRHGFLCWYGDHVPIMPEVYETLGEPAADTSYLIWSSRESLQSKPRDKDIDISDLAAHLIDIAVCQKAFALQEQEEE